jgi:hypothetical protein
VYTHSALSPQGGELSPRGSWGIFARALPEVLTVNVILRAVQEGRLNGCEVFLYTDNQTAEGSYFRGTAKSRGWADTGRKL